MSKANIDITKIIEEYGAYYLKNGQNLKRIKKALTQPADTLAIPGIFHHHTDESIYQLAEAILKPLLQPYQHKFTPKGEVKFVPNVIKMGHMKIDAMLEPDTIHDSWLAFLEGSDVKDIEKWPIVRWFVEEYCIKKAIEEKEMEVIYKGVQKNPSDGVAGEAKDCFDGFKKILTDGSKNLDSPIAQIAIGALSADTIFDQIEEFSTKIGSLYAKKNISILIAPEMKLAYLRKARALGYYDPKTDSEIRARVDFTSHQLVESPAMAGTTDIFATIPGNIIHISRRDLNKTKFDIQKQDRDVKLLTDWDEGIGFGTNSLVWTSDSTVAPGA